MKDCDGNNYIRIHQAIKHFGFKDADFLVSKIVRSCSNRIYGSLALSGTY